MRIIRHWRHCPESAHESVLTPGNFDGVHRGHREIIRRTVGLARVEKLPAAVMTFEPHPLTVLKPGTPPLRITPFRRKAMLLSEMGIDVLFVIPFTLDFSAMAAEEFAEEVLARSLRVRHLVAGHDFIFGQGRGGGGALLERMSGPCGFRFTQIPAISGSGDGREAAFSSTRIRACLREGDIAAAADMLGHDYVIEGRVRRGDRRGHTLGFPTANLALKDHLRPRLGVYVSEIRIGKGMHRLPAVTNIGRKPTFSGQRDLAETHILDFTGDIYGARLEVRPLHFLRPEKKFDSSQALRDQIAHDCASARNFFSAHAEASHAG